MSRSPLEYLRHILDEIRYLARQSRHLDRMGFVQDETLKRAFVRSLEIIGEAAERVPDDFRRKYPQVPWRDMAGMRLPTRDQCLASRLTKSSRVRTPKDSAVLCKGGYVPGCDHAIPPDVSWDNFMYYRKLLNEF